MIPHLALAGFMGTGKSTIGLELSIQYSLSFIDLDLFIQESEGLSISSIFENKGESYFRTIERRSLQRSLSLNPRILSLGGGTLFHNSDIFKQQNNYKVINLKCSYDTIHKRISKSKRPLINHNLEQLFNQRKQFQYDYDFTVFTDRHSVTDCCQRIGKWANL